MASKRIERVLLVLGCALVVAFVVLIASGFYLKWMYRPTEALAWTDIRTMRTEVSVGLLARNTHRWFARLVTIGLPIYALVFAFAGSRKTMVVKRRRWAASLFLMVVGVIGPAVIVTTMEVRMTLRRWYLVHESPAYLLFPAVVLAMWFVRGPGHPAVAVVQVEILEGIGLPTSSVSQRRSR